MCNKNVGGCERALFSILLMGQTIYALTFQSPSLLMRQVQTVNET